MVRKQNFVSNAFSGSQQQIQDMGIIYTRPAQRPTCRPREKHQNYD